MARRVASVVIFAALGAALLAPYALAGSPTRLTLNEGYAFRILGHSCGGIQQRVYVNGFAPSGYPRGNAYLSTRCGGSGRGGGGGSTTYTGSASVVWTWFGETRTYGTPAEPGGETAVAAEDGYHDRVYNTGTAAYLQTGEPPLQPPQPPTGVSASIFLSDEPPEDLRMTVGWSVAPETAPLIKSSTATATPVGSAAPVLSATVGPYFSSTVLQPVEPGTTYRVTVTTTDSEGTSAPSVPVEIKSPNSDGEAEKQKTPAGETCQQNQGTIKLSPGLSEKPAVQDMLLKGQLKACDGPFGFESATYVDHLKTTEPVTCSVLSSASVEPITTAVSLAMKWAPAESGTSKGSLIVPLSEVPLTSVTGTFTGGPFGSPATVSAGAVTESFRGGSTCGQTVRKKKAKAVKKGTFATGAVQIG
jgi:hypothetical protein